MLKPSTKKRIIVVVVLFAVVGLLGTTGNKTIKNVLTRTLSIQLNTAINEGINDFISDSKSNSKVSSSSSKEEYKPKEDLDFVYEGKKCVGVIVDGALKEFDSSGNLKGVNSKLNSYVKKYLKSIGKDY